MKSTPFVPLTPAARAERIAARIASVHQTTDYILSPELESFGVVNYSTDSRANLDRRASSIVTATGQPVRVTIEDGPAVRYFGTYSLRPGRHGHSGRNHLPNCPVMFSAASEYR